MQSSSRDGDYTSEDDVFSQEDSKKYGPTEPSAYAYKKASNKEMIGNHKFIQSQQLFEENQINPKM